jgi:carbamoyltransferase
VNVLGYGGLHQSVAHKRAAFPDLQPREYRIAQGFDSAAALVTSQGIVAAAAEERFTRQKTTGAFPVHAIRFCLEAGRLAPQDVDWVAHGFSYEPYRDIFDATEEARAQYDAVYNPDVQRRNLVEFFPDAGWPERFVPVDHHIAHAASAFYPSGFPEALIVVSDGMSEAHSLTVAVGRGADIDVLARVPAMHSLGILYGVFTLYLGFNFGVDEYKVMGLAPYGDARRYYPAVADLVRFTDDGTYLIPEFGRNATTFDKQTHRGILASLAERLGPPREPGAEVTARHKDIAAALQAVVQACQLHVLRHFQRQTGLTRLCLAGGVALNCSANGVVRRSRLFSQTFVQPAAGDDGAALGAALWVQRQKDPTFALGRMSMPFWGPGYDRAAIDAALVARPGCASTRPADDDALVRDAAARLARGEIVGWFDGRMEYGPRALGARSILADPRQPDMRDRINALVKKREGFRPFAPIVTAEAASTYFDIPSGDDQTFAHMLFVTQVRPEFRATLPAVTHVDGSARAQTVAERDVPRLWALLRAFEGLTGLPVLLNTSFNVKGQPIVCTPAEALDTFLFAGLDALVLGDLVVTASANDAEAERRAAGDRITLGVG